MAPRYADIAAILLPIEVNVAELPCYLYDLTVRTAMPKYTQAAYIDMYDALRTDSVSTTLDLGKSKF